MRNDPRASQALVHIRPAKSNHRYQIQHHTSSGHNCKPDNDARTTLGHRQGYEPEASSNDQHETTLRIICKDG
ncbi:hypothetical protein HBI25_214040 [Parastagonospora nodorum]|nr:hypothetical protein HBH49_032060 [Parastagonospora nodorum]KAH4069014.1 hypothetical protein HBH50_107640 [Parastagonospora nodorum]KAH4088082.1 hypothetical protein HBH48_124600 [Parastagonospora nodorum]KAH4133116.1 hypothetical protein HBH47_007810 [Parastagonospora nodorum]KAH4198839.1 hypothetical protein HBH42_049520 [Parastagonospora nodorum]